MKFSGKLNCHKSLEEYSRGNFEMAESTKSLFVYLTYVYRYGARHAQAWGGSSKTSVTKYDVEKVFVSFAMKLIN